MRILVTNDDGITAPGLKAAEEIASELAGPEGEVWVVAPAMEQSGVSHCISYVRPIRLEDHGPRRFAAEGSPADCVLAGVCDLMADTPPDLVISGVNRGHNVAEDTLYSGTVGGAIEAALQGVRAIALSQYYGPENLKLEDPFEAARAMAPKICRRLVEAGTWHDKRYGVFYNVNFPPVPAAEAKGVKVTFQGHRPYATFGVQPQTAPNGRRYLWLKHGTDKRAEPGSDAQEALEGYATVTPLRADLTAYSLLGTIGEAMDGV